MFHRVSTLSRRGSRFLSTNQAHVILSRKQPILSFQSFYFTSFAVPLQNSLNNTTSSNHRLQHNLTFQRSWRYFSSDNNFTDNNSLSLRNEASFYDSLQKRTSSEAQEDNKGPKYRLSKVISSFASNSSLSRNQAERLIRNGHVTIAGVPIKTPQHLISLEEANHSGIKVRNKLLQITNTNENTNNSTNDNNHTKPTTRVWLAHKLPGELVTEDDPYDRPSLIERLRRGGVGPSSSHLKPIGRLDMQTEGLILITNDGAYAHEMEHPKNRVHRTYRVRTFGNLTEMKLNAIRKGTIVIDGVRYDKMKVTIDRGQGERRRKNQNGGKGPANTWLKITCMEGKNRMIRKVLDHLGCEF